MAITPAPAPAPACGEVHNDRTRSGSDVSQESGSEAKQAKSSCGKTICKVIKYALIGLAIAAFVALNVVTFGAVFHVALAVTVIHLALASGVAAKVIGIAKIALPVADGAIILGVAAYKARQASRNLKLTPEQKQHFTLSNQNNPKSKAFREQYFERLVSREFWSYSASDLEGRNPQEAIFTILGQHGAHQFLEYLKDKQYYGVMPYIDLSVFTEGMTKEDKLKWETFQLNALTVSENGSSVTMLCELHDDLFLRMINQNTMYVRDFNLPGASGRAGIVNTPNNNRIVTQELVNRAIKAIGHDGKVDCSNTKELNTFMTILESNLKASKYRTAILKLNPN
ncbi:MAG: hypothetical protein P0S95_07250 [Rhabdochlamydiaceae bacterium]|nr:hypothetical protein [Candidatus Amphrikana amoebophyrae]